ncbi:hypothetical protein SNEBB_010631 [Seison nebaliae]|nr:hypothetical protein SNEBB_010631 [Seison nebaliae]
MNITNEYRIYLQRIFTFGYITDSCILPFFIIISTIGNLLSFIILKRKNLRNSSTVFYLATLSLTDISVMYCFGIKNVLRSTHHLSIRELNIVTCRLHVFLLNLLTEYSSWLLVAVSIDRFITISTHSCLNGIAKKYCRPRFARIVTCGLFILLGILNSHILMFWGEGKRNDSFQSRQSTNHHNDTTPRLLIANEEFKEKIKITKVECVYSKYAYYDYFANNIFPFIYLFIYVLLPFTCMLVFNLLIIITKLRSDKKLDNYRLRNSNVQSIQSTVNISSGELESELTQCPPKQHTNHKPRHTLTINPVSLKEKRCSESECPFINRKSKSFDELYFSKLETLYKDKKRHPSNVTIFNNNNNIDVMRKKSEELSNHEYVQLKKTVLLDTSQNKRISFPSDTNSGTSTSFIKKRKGITAPLFKCWMKRNRVSSASPTPSPTRYLRTIIQLNNVTIPKLKTSLFRRPTRPRAFSLTTLRSIRRQRAQRQKSLTCMLLSVTICFLVLATPNTFILLFINLKSDALRSNRQANILFLLRNCNEVLIYLNHSSNFLLYILSGTIFRTEFLNLFRSLFRYCSMKKKY